MEMNFEEGSKIDCVLKSVFANMDGRKKDILKLLTHSVEKNVGNTKVNATKMTLVAWYNA